MPLSVLLLLEMVISWTLPLEIKTPGPTTGVAPHSTYLRFHHLGLTVGDDMTWAGPIGDVTGAID